MSDVHRGIEIGDVVRVCWIDSDANGDTAIVRSLPRGQGDLIALDYCDGTTTALINPCCSEFAGLVKDLKGGRSDGAYCT